LYKKGDPWIRGGGFVALKLNRDFEKINITATETSPKEPQKVGPNRGEKRRTRNERGRRVKPGWTAIADRLCVSGDARGVEGNK